MDKLRAMALFVKTVEQGNLSRAAQQAGISTAGVSRAVAELEAHLGVRLLQRSSRHLGLTEAGQSYFHHCRQVLAEIESAEAEVSAQLVSPSGTLKLNVPLSFGVRHLSPLWPRLLAQYPDLRLEMVLTDQTADLMEEGFDLAIRIRRLRDSSLVARKLAETRVLMVASPAYLQQHGTPAKLADLIHHHCLSYSYSSQRDEWEVVHRPSGKSERIAFHSRMRANNGDVLTEAARQGMGISMAPTFLVGDDLKQGTLVQVLPEYEAPAIGIHAVFPSRLYMPAKVRMLLDFLQEAFGPNPDHDPWLPEFLVRST